MGRWINGLVAAMLLIPAAIVGWMLIQLVLVFPLFVVPVVVALWLVRRWIRRTTWDGPR